MAVASQRNTWQLWLFPEVWTVPCNQFPRGQHGSKPVNCSGVTAAGASFIWSPGQTHRIVTVPEDIPPISSGWSVFPSCLFHFDVLLCPQTICPLTLCQWGHAWKYGSLTPILQFGWNVEWKDTRGFFVGFFLLQKLMDWNVLTPKAGVRTKNIQRSISLHSQRQVFTQ